jgi:Fe-S cluster assembly ATP-binding protein
MLEVRNLSVEVGDLKILEDVSLNLKIGGINLLLGPNGSGKSTLSQVIAGNPNYKIESGEIILHKNNQEIILNNQKPEEIAKQKIFVSFQNPIEIAGVKTIQLIKESYTQIHGQKPKAANFIARIKQFTKDLGLSDKFYEKEFNVGASGGEKKKNELLQMLMLDPDLVILDEIDSGLDIDSLSQSARILNSFRSSQKTILLISHSPYLARNLPIDRVFVLNKGKLVEGGDFVLFEKIQREGYQYL